MNALTSPFAGLGQRPQRKPLNEIHPDDIPEGESKTAQMRNALRDQGPMRASELTVLVGLPNSGHVNALFKKDLAAKRILFRRGMYVFNEEFEEARKDEVANAILLLVSHGYEVRRKEPA